MRGQEVAVMLEYVKGLEPYLEVSEAAAAAWTDTLLPGIDSTWARQTIAKHYSDTGAERLTPGVLNRYWRNYQQGISAEASDRGKACGRGDCRCTHTNCDRGFRASVIHEHAVTPCPNCKPETYAMLQEIAPLGQQMVWEMSHVADSYQRQKAVRR